MVEKKIPRRQEMKTMLYPALLLDVVVPKDQRCRACRQVVAVGR